MIGQTIGQYRVLDRLGHGGMGSIYRATDEMLDREVALKVLDADIENGATRFRTEAVALAHLNHPGIATVYELFEHDGRLLMAMELVQGRTLQEIADQIGAFPPKRAVEICVEVLSALAHAHAAGITHRDLKPGNLMVTASGAIKIMDFGIARFDGSIHLTSAGATIGSPAYMAPEQVEGREIDARTDLYSIGVVFYRLLAGALPFKGETPLAMAQSHVSEAPIPIDQVRPDAPDWAREIITRALAKAPAERFQSALEFREALARVLASSTAATSGMIDPPTEAMRRPDFSGAKPTLPTDEVPRLHRVAWPWLGVAATVGLVGGMLWFGLPGPPSPVATDANQTSPEPQVAPLTGQAERAIPSPSPPVSTPTSSPTPAPGPANAAAPPEASAPVRFDNVRLLTVRGRRTIATDVSLTFAGDQLIVASRAATDSLAAIPYRSIAAATYVYAADPRWSPGHPAPAGQIDVPGIFGRRRHWIVVQTGDTYAILQLDDRNWSEILKTFEARTGVTVSRPPEKHESPRVVQAGLPNR